MRRLVHARHPVWFVLVCEAITDVDVTAAGMLDQLDRELNADGVHMAFVEMRTRLQDLVEQYGLLQTLDSEHFYPSVDAALAAIEDGDGLNTPDGSVSTRRRVAALVSIIAFVVLALVLAGILFRHVNHLVLALGGLVRRGGGCVVDRHRAHAAPGHRHRRRGPRARRDRVAIARALDGADRVALRSVLVVVLFAVVITAARAAMLPDLHGLELQVRAGGPPRRAVLLCNPWSGGGKVERFGLVDLATQLGVETVMLDRGLDLEQLARDAVARGADCLGMAGRRRIPGAGRVDRHRARTCRSCASAPARATISRSISD